ncbi:MAG: beta-ketoacyl synthase N-terminal-like domain-containing protein [Capnocytophaga sp.]|nr:beta-ketoacyl synthase N-terminal-like domain-containing protein [Capnocytophaga sp.]
MKISITGMGSVSALGSSYEPIYAEYRSGKSLIGNHQGELSATLHESARQEVAALVAGRSDYASLDPTVHYAIVASRKAVTRAGWKGGSFGVNIGSSRGATASFETHYQYFIDHYKCLPMTSPSTTLGNIASWVAQDVGAEGFEMSHSITCSTALHAVANAVAWLQSGMEQRFLVGGSEAPLTPFTFAQTKALRIHATEFSEYPCRAMHPDKTKNSMVLGEGAAVFCLEHKSVPHALANIIGIGYASEKITHGASISADARSLQKSMEMALTNIPKESIDVAVLHSPGTIRGDAAEINAVDKVFGKNKPILTCNKWKIGHTYGASGALSLEMAILMLQKQTFFPVPYLSYPPAEKSIQRILVNAVGFGGNAVSVIVERV